MIAAAANDALLATEAADYLVRRGMPFRQAHDIVGKLLREAERQNKKWTQLPLAELKKLSPIFEDDFSSELECGIRSGRQIRSWRHGARIRPNSL